MPKSQAVSRADVAVAAVRVNVKRQVTGDAFGRISARASAWLGSRWAFLVALFVIAAWEVTGPIFHYPDTWQLIINTGTTIVTLLMVFLIQNTQNRDSKAINLKLDELIRAIDGAANHMLDIESLSDEELDELQKRYVSIREKCLHRESRKETLV